MNNLNIINRRMFLKQLTAMGAVCLLPSFLTSCESDRAPKRKMDPNFVPDIELNITAYENEIQIFSGKPTKVLMFHGDVIKGNSNALSSIPDSYLGPIIRVKTEDKLRINFINKVPEVSIIHWHGLHISTDNDGHPRYVINEGEKYVYEFEVLNRPGTYWFHPHPHKLTGNQVYSGLAGLFIVSNDAEEKLNLPSGEFEIPLVIQDRKFDKDNQLVYLQNRMDALNGFAGDQILVNGKPNFKLSVSNGIYRFRILNGSNSRSYKLAWNDNTPLIIMGTDGGLLESPIEKKYLMLGPGERYDLWVDFSKYKLGEELVLKSLPFSGAIMQGMAGMMGRGMMQNDTSIPIGSEYDLFRVKVENQSSKQFTLPKRLSEINGYKTSDAINTNNPREFVFAMNRMTWTINGRTFETTEVENDEKVKLNTLEIWEFINGFQSGRMMGGGMMGGMMQMYHPVHIHGLQFKIIERIIDENYRNIWDTVKDGFVDEGWKDTFLLIPGTRVKVLLKFEDFAGLFLYHCHNLEHEDMGMMRNYLIQS